MPALGGGEGWGADSAGSSLVLRCADSCKNEYWVLSLSRRIIHDVGLCNIYKINVVRVKWFRLSSSWSSGERMSQFITNLCSEFVRGEHPGERWSFPSTMMIVHWFENLSWTCCVFSCLDDFIWREIHKFRNLLDLHCALEAYRCTANDGPGESWTSVKNKRPCYSGIMYTNMICIDTLFRLARRDENYSIAERNEEINRRRMERARSGNGGPAKVCLQILCLDVVFISVLSFDKLRLVCIVFVFSISTHSQDVHHSGL